ncbi:hypothetical protein ACKAWT_19725 [Xanthomonas vasicola]|uniref:hypothetical protein n=1 Tax=Xanthomonas vasicola TaxID=56459 RepID=UPI0001CBEE65|nr:hypothetical protein [Xanthomonas vasicola]MDO6936359.1 hypothetical protein [Xanthomonas vasicola]MDO6949884.1 hypothetical protein [Xanthomonas vasicola]MDO6953925.1 hypothetical protein [Xanthomonas vasicola]MDO6957822.1 hypothetical protein [Xanthomonas vasicola]MDO6961895.1 hypothetical protein [Xanthomonas vasicola]
MALHLGKSHGRQVNQGRNAFPQATLLSIALLALCTLHAGCAPSTPRDQLAIAAAKPSSETRSKDVTERLKQDVDRLIATDFQDVADVSTQLQAQFGPRHLDGERELRVSEQGVLAGKKVRHVEFINATDDPSRGKLVIDFSPPGPIFMESPWVDAIPYPPRPDARDSRAYWEMTVNGTKVIFGLTEDQSHLSYISISKL